MSASSTHHANGRSKTPIDLTSVKEERRLLRARIKLAQEKKLLESLMLWDDYSSWGGNDLWDRLRPQTQDQGSWIPVSIPSDRKHGSNWPVYRNQFELDTYRAQSRLRAETNTYAIAILNNLTNNIIGKGCTYKVEALGPDGKPQTKDASPQDTALAREAQRIVDEFLRDNHWNGGTSPSDTTALAGTRERQIFQAVKADGECFVRFHRMGDGKVKARLVPGEQIRQVEGTEQDGWSYGIQHQMEPFEDVETPLAYSVYWPDPSAKGGEGDSAADRGSYEHIDADEMLHLKGMNTPSTVKRGLGMFLFDLGAAVDRAAKLQRNASIAASIRAAIAETWQHATATQAQVQSMADALAESTTTDANGTSVNNERIRPGAIRRGDAGWQLVQPSADNTGSFLTAKDGDLQQAAAGAGVAAFVLTDLNAGNYSNFESAAYPPVQNAVCEQEYFKTAFARCAWHAILWAVECGRLDKAVLRKCTVTVEAPAVLHRNEQQQASTDQIGVQVGWKSRQQCAAERGLDWHAINAENTEYAKTHPQPGAAPPGGPPGGGMPPPGMGLGESRETLPERLTRLRETYGDALADQITTAAARLIREAAVENQGQSGHFHDSVTGKPVPAPGKNASAPKKKGFLSKVGGAIKKIGSKVERGIIKAFGGDPDIFTKKEPVTSSSGPAVKPAESPGKPEAKPAPDATPKPDVQKMIHGIVSSAAHAGVPHAAAFKSLSGADQLSLAEQVSGHPIGELMADPGKMAGLVKSLEGMGVKIAPPELEDMLIFQHQRINPDNAPLRKITPEPNEDLKHVQAETNPSSLTQGEKVAMQQYTRGSDYALNSNLRAGKPVGKDVEKINERLQDAFKKTKPIRPPVKVVRGMHLEGADLKKFIDNVVESAKAGQPLRMDGYISTSTSEEGAKAFKGNIALKINAVQGLDVSHVSKFGNEKELLLNHGSHFKVRKAVKMKDGSYVIHLDQLPPTSKAA